jgi:hypothetical protein
MVRPPNSLAPNPAKAVEDRIKDFILIFTSIVYEAMPFIVLGAVIAGILEEMVPQRLLARLIPKNRWMSIFAGAGLGLLFPMCECGIIPIMRRLLRKGLPLSTCTAYLLAGPIINVVVILSTSVAFSNMEKATDEQGHLTYQMGSVWMVGMRVGVGYLVAVGASMLVERLYRRYGNSLLMPLAMPPSPEKLAAAEAAADEPRPWPRRLGNITETALHDFVDITVFLILGALLAAFTRQLFTRAEIEVFSRAYPVLSIGAMMGMAVLLCLCSEADAFVAASYISMRPAAKLAFLVLGPMLDLKLYLMYTRVFRPRLIWTIIPAVVIQVLIWATLVHFLWEYFAPQFFSVPLPGPTGTGG